MSSVVYSPSGLQFVASVYLLQEASPETEEIALLRPLLVKCVTYPAVRLHDRVLMEKGVEDMIHRSVSVGILDIPLGW